jgi:anti-sigma B factor antagonist
MTIASSPPRRPDRHDGQSRRAVPDWRVGHRVAPEFGSCLLVLDGGDIVVDIAGLTFIDSSGIRAVLRAHQRCLDGGVALGCAHRLLKPPTVFRISGVDQVLTLEP